MSCEYRSEGFSVEASRRKDNQKSMRRFEIRARIQFGKTLQKRAPPCGFAPAGIVAPSDSRGPPISWMPQNVQRTRILSLTPAFRPVAPDRPIGKPF
jgi:hypothetical protein